MIKKEWYFDKFFLIKSKSPWIIFIALKRCKPLIKKTSENIGTRDFLVKIEIKALPHEPIKPIVIG